MAEQLEGLAPLESFDAAAFCENDDVPQHLCNLVLCLALIYDDYKDIALVVGMLHLNAPEGPIQETKQMGEHSGMFLHAFRATVAVLHELLRLIQAGKKSIGHPFFETVLKDLPREARDSWTQLVDAAEGGQGPENLKSIFSLIRSKTFAHYIGSELLLGYRDLYVREPHTLYVSRGRNMIETRFYFADGAATAYLRKITEGRDVGKLFREVTPYLNALNVALSHIVVSFIQKRGFAFAEHKAKA